ncbi:MAG: SPOR domain-containing protein [Gammaproteobacteria bacterium]|nr:SPOR domain-containing protein [Gammaproteobacteria bacterium]
MIVAIHYAGNKTRMSMLMNRILPFILLMVISCTAAAEDVFWVLGSFVDEDVARVEGNRISNDAGIEVLLFESMVSARVQYRLLAGVPVAPGDQAALGQQLMKVGVADPWMLQFEDGAPYMETVFPDLGTGDALSALELAEIDTMLRDFEDEYTEGAGMSTEDIASGLVSNPSGGLARNYVVAGSYGTARRANDYASKLGNAFPEILSHEVTMRRSEVSGEIVYRVMIGPVLPSEETALIGSLGEWGVVDAWLLPGTAQADIDLPQAPQANSPDFDENIIQPGNQTSVMPVKSSRTQSDFNPVRLRKDAPKFPDPRNKH